MTEEGVGIIELELGLVLPEDYKQVLLHYPFAPEGNAYYDELFGDAEHLVYTNRAYREGSFFG